MSDRNREPTRYYEALRKVPFRDVVRQLCPERITQDLGTRLLVDCPRHVSSSGRSLNVDLHASLFFCFACRVGGDALQFIEFVRTGSVTKKGRDGRMSVSHREARDELAKFAGLDPLSKIADANDVEAIEARGVAEDAVFLALTDLALIQCERLLARPDALEFCRQQWGFGPEVIERFCIGFSDTEDFEALCAKGHEASVIFSTGTFSGEDRDGHPKPFFRGRITLPYRSRGRVVYMIGRRSPWTPNVDWERAKYKKLATYNESSCSHVSKLIRNDHLWGEDILVSSPKVVVITEGVTDAIWLQLAGFACVSPVTVRFQRADSERLVRAIKRAQVERVVLVQDNEVSGIGLDGAMQTADLLRHENIDCRIGRLPLRQKQIDARKALEDLLGEDAWASILRCDPGRRGSVLTDLLRDRPRDRAAVEPFLDAAKIDIAEWFRTGGTQDEFAAILESAVDPIEIALERLEPNVDPVEQVARLEGLLASIGERTKAEGDAILTRIKNATGVGLGVLRDGVRRAKKGRPSDRGKNRATAPSIPIAEPGSCREIVEKATLDAASAQSPVDWCRVANDVFAWIEGRGGQFFRTPDGRPFLHFENELFELTPNARGGRERLYGLLLRHTGVVSTSGAGRQLYPALAHIAADRGKVREIATWCSWEPSASALYFDLANEKNEIARITPNGVEIVPNGTDSVILWSDRKRFRPVAYDTDGGDDAVSVLSDVVGKKLACDDDGRRIAVLWTASIILMPLLDVRPMLRAQGPSGSGKSEFTKVITTLWFGVPQDENASVAALYAQAASSALVAMDNLETRDATPELVNFVLGLVTGASRSKRARNSDSDVVQERPMSLAISNGIESFAPDRVEAVNRTFAIVCDSKHHERAIIESALLEGIRRSRDRCFSVIMRHAAKCLAAMKDGRFQSLHENLSRVLGDHAKRRCNSFLSLMLLHLRICSGKLGDGEVDREADSPFLDLVDRLNGISGDGQREANPIALAFDALFAAIANPDSRGALVASSGLTVSQDGLRIDSARATQLYLALSRAAKDCGVRLPFRHANQLSVRIRSSLDDLEANGIRVVVTEDLHACVPRFTISRRVDAGRSPPPEDDPHDAGDPDDDDDDPDDLGVSDANYPMR